MPKHLQTYFVKIATKEKRPIGRFTFLQLAKKNIVKAKGKDTEFVSRDIDTILYGR